MVFIFGFIIGKDGYLGVDKRSQRLEKYFSNINMNILIYILICTVELIDSSLLFTKTALDSSPLDTYEKGFSSDHCTKDIFFLFFGNKEIYLKYLFYQTKKKVYLERVA